MPRIRKVFILTFLSAVLLGGCTTTQNPSQAARLNVSMARLADVADHRLVQRNSFSKNDRPVAVLQNLGSKDQTVQVEFIHVDSSRTVFNRGTVIMPREVKAIGPTEPLTAGTYTLKVTPQNSPPLMQTFAVYGN